MATTTKKATESTETAETVKADNPAAATEKTENKAVQATVQAAVQAAAKVAARRKDAAVYTAAEFAAASGKVFDKDYGPDIVNAAFRMAGKTKATKTEAVEILSDFLKKEVKLK